MKTKQIIKKIKNITLIKNAERGMNDRLGECEEIINGEKQDKDEDKEEKIKKKIIKINRRIAIKELRDKKINIRKE